jgi:hypothetical protein
MKRRALVIGDAALALFVLAAVVFAPNVVGQKKEALIRVGMPLKEVNELVFRERRVYPSSLAWNGIHVGRPQDAVRD